MFLCVELYLSNFPEENRDFDKLFFETKFLKNINCVVVDKYFWSVVDENGSFNNRNYKYKFFIGSTEKIKSYETSKENFIGMYGNFKNPRSLTENEQLSDACGKNLDPVVCIHNVINLSSCENKNLSFYMGIEESYEEIKNVLFKYKNVFDIELECIRF